MTGVTAKVKDAAESQFCTVAIVGAGISGLAAAKTLMENGVSSVIILEAQSQPGGRICSVPVDDYFVELGAQWIHGTKNEVFAISNAHDLLADESSPEGQGLFLRENGDKIDDAIIKEVEYVVSEILEKCEAYVNTDKFPRSVGEELFEKFDEYLKSCTNDSEEKIQIKKELLNWHVKFTLVDNSCSDLHNLSAKAWGLFKFCGGSEYVNFKNGYISLINSIIENLAKNTVRCNSVVERIYWLEELHTEENGEKPYKAKIITKDGLTVHSQYVIVTSSLGYLKSNYESMFVPPLPNYLSKAIESLGFGGLDKIFLIYKNPWWDAQSRGFQLVWSDKELEPCASDWTKYITGFDVVFRNKPILLGWVAGDGAMMVEKVSEEQIGLKATEVLRQFTGNKTIPLPEKVMRTKWWGNEFVKGAYSHIPVNCDKDNISGSNLARPVYSVIHEKKKMYKKPTILLAGEATHQNYFSTVHGAYESGQNQAQVILKDLQS